MSECGLPAFQKTAVSFLRPPPFASLRSLPPRTCSPVHAAQWRAGSARNYQRTLKPAPAPFRARVERQVRPEEGAAGC